MPSIFHSSYILTLTYWTGWSSRRDRWCSTNKSKKWPTSTLIVWIDRTGGEKREEVVAYSIDRSLTANPHVSFLHHFSTVCTVRRKDNGNESIVTHRDCWFQRIGPYPFRSMTTDWWVAHSWRICYRIYCYYCYPIGVLRESTPTRPICCFYFCYCVISSLWPRALCRSIYSADPMTHRLDLLCDAIDWRYSDEESLRESARIQTFFFNDFFFISKIDALIKFSTQHSNGVRLGRKAQIVWQYFENV